MGGNDIDIIPIIEHVEKQLFLPTGVDCIDKDIFFIRCFLKPTDPNFPELENQNLKERKK